MHVIERAGDEPVSTEATGQLTLDLYADVPRQKPGDSRVEAPRNHIGWSVQESLHGEPVPMEDLQRDDLHPRFTTERWRDPNKPSAREKAAQHPAQSTLEPWAFGENWVVNPASDAGIRIAD